MRKKNNLALVTQYKHLAWEALWVFQRAQFDVPVGAWALDDFLLSRPAFGLSQIYRAPVKAHWLDEEIFVGKLVLTPMFHRALLNHNIINRDRGIYHMVLPLERELHNQLANRNKKKVKILLWVSFINKLRTSHFTSWFNSQIKQHCHQLIYDCW